MNTLETLATPHSDLDGALSKGTVSNSAHYICKPGYPCPVQYLGSENVVILNRVTDISQTRFLCGWLVSIERVGARNI